MQPIRQSLCSGIRDLTSQVVPLLVVHELQRSPQVLQQMQHPEATQKRWSGWLAVKQPVGVVHGLGALREINQRLISHFYIKSTAVHWVDKLLRLKYYFFDPQRQERNNLQPKLHSVLIRGCGASRMTNDLKLKISAFIWLYIYFFFFRNFKLCLSPHPTKLHLEWVPFNKQSRCTKLCTYTELLVMNLQRLKYGYAFFHQM